MKYAFVRQVIWCVVAVILLTFSLGISWQISKTTNFLYSFWYQTLHIDEVIKKNVPKNTQGKRDFPVDNFQLHEKMFAEIVDAIHQQGNQEDNQLGKLPSNTLSKISYVNHQSISKALLTKSEVVHLQDVANLLRSVEKLWWVNLLILLGMIFFYCRKEQTISVNSIRVMPTGKQKIISLLSFIILLVAILSIWGFTEVFYYLHTVVFPENHQWFFYYRDSLMATLMKAPDIFSAIAAQLLLIALFLTWGVDTVLRRYQVKHSKQRA
jgi:uncharacterized membrane protein